MDEYFLSETYSPISSTVASWSELLVYVEFCNFMSSVWEFFCVDRRSTEVCSRLGRGLQRLQTLLLNLLIVYFAMPAGGGTSDESATLAAREVILLQTLLLNLLIVYFTMPDGGGTRDESATLAAR